MDEKTIEEKSLRQGIELVRQGMFQKALAIFEEILDFHPEEPRTLFNAAVVLDQLGQREKALALLRRSMNADPSFANPYDYLGRLYLQSGNYSEAYCAFRDAIARNVEYSSAYEGIRLALLAMGQSVIDDKTDVVFYTGGYPFNGGTMNERGLGGSESALVYIARSLTAQGIRVRVFCNCDRPGEYDGVRYDSLIDFHIYRNQCTLPVFVSSRSLRPFKTGVKARARILWIHDAVDVPFLEGEDPSRLPIDSIFAISHWQRDEWSRHFGIPIERFFTTRNGVDLAMFRPNEKRSRRLIYVSRPDRGLNVLLELFPYIQRRVSDAELHVYSYQLPGDKFDEFIYQRAQQPGVYLHGSLPKAALAAEMSAARLMVYPSTWRETSCIAAIEAQASGTPVVASTLAALSETVQDGTSGYLIPGDPRSSEFRRRFVDAVVTLMNDDGVWQELSRGARCRSELLYNWNAIAKEWIEYLKRLVDAKSVGL